MKTTSIPLWTICWFNRALFGSAIVVYVLVFWVWG